MYLQAQRKYFDSLNEDEQWRYALFNKQIVRLKLAPDATFLYFYGDEMFEHPCKFKADIGNRFGLEFLLSNIGFEFDDI